MASSYTKVTKDKILQKVNRKRNPVSSLTGLAREFHLPLYGENRSVGGPAPSGAFRRHVLSEVGTKVYQTIKAK